MSDSLRFSPCVQSLQRRKPCESSSGHVSFLNCFSTLEPRAAALVRSPLGFPIKTNNTFQRNIMKATAWSTEDPVQDLDAPVSIELQPIVSEAEFDRMIAEAQQLEESVIVVWMASWCRKCIYLKPKLEKLAAHYHPRIRFYCVDVNIVPHKLVTRAGINKMPTIQAEVIGGHKAHLVVNEVHDMINNEPSI
ncbi:PREDICTED: thioredoxin-like 3-2, chloroplastic isoform X2 [Nelumbo nucifera]|uniref:Thioredoxin-like 3-2, chloroplastic isoform X2 n=1 Tax=Nelumbo nucifera TaxID=4432 RepID=A0A1U7YVE7_NELNU|nr:PREDICTED: thioredoxin-like 3-2, chloroplastic isoform X2 [Nelumbo nucifera]